MALTYSREEEGRDSPISFVVLSLTCAGDVAEIWQLVLR